MSQIGVENHVGSADTIHFVGRIVAGAYYDHQSVRIASNNRIRDVIRKKIEDIKFDAVEEKKEGIKEKKYTDKELIKFWDKLLSNGKIDKKEHRYMLRCLEISKESEKIEKKYQKAMMEYISTEPVYHGFLSKIRGIGPVLSANLIKEFGDCSKYTTLSRMWAHTGNQVINGKAPKRKKGENINYNPKLRTLTWKISDCLMKLNKGYYRMIYDTEKEKQLFREYKEGELFEIFGKPYKGTDIKLSKMHAHNRALRKMRKIFLSHYYECAKELSGQDASRIYVEGILGHEDLVNWKEAIEYEHDVEG